MIKRNIHMMLEPIGKDRLLWICMYCQIIGELEALLSGECLFVYPPCETCGGSETSNECKPDCAACWSAIAELDGSVSTGQ